MRHARLIVSSLGLLGVVGCHSDSGGGGTGGLTVRARWQHVPSAQSEQTAACEFDSTTEVPKDVAAVRLFLFSKPSDPADGGESCCCTAVAGPFENRHIVIDQIPAGEVKFTVEGYMGGPNGVSVPAEMPSGMSGCPDGPVPECPRPSPDAMDTVIQCSDQSQAILNYSSGLVPSQIFPQQTTAVDVCLRPVGSPIPTPTATGATPTLTPTLTPTGGTPTLTPTEGTPTLTPTEGTPTLTPTGGTPTLTPTVTPTGGTATSTPTGPTPTLTPTGGTVTPTRTPTGPTPTLTLTPTGPAPVVTCTPPSPFEPTPTPRLVAYVANADDDTVTMIDARENVVIPTPISLAMPGQRRGLRPQNVTLSPDACSVYVTNLGAVGSSLSVIDTATSRLDASRDPLVPNNGGTLGLAVNQGGDNSGVGYVTNVTSNVLFRIDTPTCLRPGPECVVATTLRLTRPYGISVSLDGHFVYVTNAVSPTVTVFAADRTLECTALIGAGPGHGIATSNTGRILVADTGADRLSVIDPRCVSPTPNCRSVAPGCVRDDIEVGDQPEAVAVRPDPTGRSDIAYVTNRGSRSVSIVDLGAATPTQVEVPLTGRPHGVAFRPDGAYAYVTGTDDAEEGVVWVIDSRDPVRIPTPTLLHVGNGPRGVAVGQIAPAPCGCVSNAALQGPR